MKSFISFLLFINIFHYLFAVIPNWDLDAIGENIMTSDEVTYRVINKIWAEHTLTMTSILKKEGETITKINKVKIGDLEREVPFDNIESFYHFKNNYYICPKGNYHLYDFTGNKNVTPNYHEPFVEKSGFELKCWYHDASKTFLVSYVMNGGDYALYGINVYWDQPIESIKKIAFLGESYDFKLDSTELDNEEYYMLSLNHQTSNIYLSNVKATLRKRKDDKYAYDQAFSQVGNFYIDEARTYVKAYFKVSESDNFNDFYYISYGDLDNFYSGFSTFAPSFGDLTGVNVNKSKATFEFFEDVEIEEMNFMLYNRYVYYKMKLKSNSQIVYHGIYDTKINNVIFNTEETLKYFFPYSDREMIAVTDTAAYKICAMKGTDGTCVDYCEVFHLLDTQGNKCSSSDSCPEGKVKLMPSEVCNDTCDENFYVLNGTECGLCQYFNNKGNKYKLVGSKECRGSIDESKMEYYNEKYNLLKCKEGFILQNNDCVQNITCYERCEECIEYSSDESNQKCKSCKDGYFFQNQNCLLNCSQGYEKKEKTCIFCNNTCDTYETDSCDCISCLSSYFLNGKKCEECVNCLECNHTATTCTDCWENYFLYNEKCYKCAENCKQYEDSDQKCKCQKCNEGFYNSNFQCLSCLSNCASCTNSTQCLKCKDGFFVNNRGECSECPQNCEKRKSDGCQCEKCLDNFFMNSTTQDCQKCDTECKTCVGSSNNCTSCSDNNSFVNKNNKCEKCDAECETCFMNSTFCTSCFPGTYLNDEHECKECSEICLTCFSGPSNGDDNCLSCKDNKYLIKDDYNKTCVDNCTENGREISENSFECKPLSKKNDTTPEGDKGKNDPDYLLWIFIAITAVLLIIVTICICKKCCGSGKTGDLLEDMQAELANKDGDGENGIFKDA